MKKHKAIIWITCFLIIVASPVLTYFFLGQYIDTENYENRNMTSKPVFTLGNWETFPGEYETYYNDNIPFRNQLIRFNNSIDLFFKQSSSKRVDIGKEDWLFYCNSEDGNPVEQSLGYWNYTNDQLHAVADGLMSTKRVLESLGIEFVLFIAPNKETIYREKLPDYYEVKSNYTSTDQLVDYLKKNTDIRIVYPKQELLNAKQEYPEIYLYHKLDTHWNYAGGYVGAISLAEELGIKMPSLDEVNLEPKLSSSGDLAKMLNLTIKDGNVDYDVSGISSLDTVNEKWDFNTEFIYHTAGTDARKIFVRRDSFATMIASALATQFENSMWVHNMSYKQQQIFDYDADVFVLEVVERYVRDLQNFRISFVSSSVERCENGVKRITITPRIDKANLQYTSIFKKANEAENVETIQVLGTFNESIVLDVSDNEEGKVYIYIYADGEGDKILEEVTIAY